MKKSTLKPPNEAASSFEAFAILSWYDIISAGVFHTELEENMSQSTVPVATTVPVITTWGMIFGLENADSPGRVHTSVEVDALIRTWMNIRFTKHEPNITALLISNGTVCFLDEKGAGREGTFKGCILHGVSYYGAAETQKMLQDLGSIITGVLGQVVVEIHCGPTGHLKRSAAPNPAEKVVLH